QVVEPGRVLGEAALGGDQDDVLAVGEVEQGGGALLAALGADMVEQEDRRHPRHRVADPPAARPVGEGVEAHHPAGDGPEPGADVEEGVGALAQVYIPPNIPPVTLIVWPWM